MAVKSNHGGRKGQRGWHVRGEHIYQIGFHGKHPIIWLSSAVEEAAISNDSPAQSSIDLDSRRQRHATQFFSINAPKTKTNASISRSCSSVQPRRRARVVHEPKGSGKAKEISWNTIQMAITISLPFWGESEEPAQGRPPEPSALSCACAWAAP